LAFSFIYIIPIFFHFKTFMRSMNFLSQAIIDCFAALAMTGWIINILLERDCLLVVI